MSSETFATPEAWERLTSVSPVQPLGHALTAILFLTVLYAWIFSRSPEINNLPVVNPIPSWSVSASIQVKKDFLEHARDLIIKGRQAFGQRPFRLNTDNGVNIVLPAEFADEIRNEPRLSFGLFNHRNFHSGIPGFEPFTLGNSDDQLVQFVARKQLTKSLSKVTEPLSEETAVALEANLGSPREWKEIAVQPAVLDIVARVSSRVFLGEELCRNEDWLRITKTYTRTAMVAAQALRLVPAPLRRLVHWFLPECQQIRKAVSEARSIMSPVIEKRRYLRRQAHEAGKPVTEFNDSIDWVESEAEIKGCAAQYDPAVFQLILSLAAIHTTTDLTMQFIRDLALHPDIVQPLRDEIARVLGTNGWKKTSLFNMKLLDSCLKETQRLKPIADVSIRRETTGPVKLSNGMELPKGTRLVVDASRMWDSSVYENPDLWDGYRFVKMRESVAGRKNMAHLVATSADHLGFGHGEHACPGRFFAANEVKVIMCHLLMKYDWKLVPGAETEPRTRGFNRDACPTLRVMLRKRDTPELDIHSI